MMSTTGERIRTLRQRRGLTLDDVARHLGVGRQTIYKYEHNKIENIPLENIEKMAALFGTSPEYLSCWTDDDAPVSHNGGDRRLFVPDSSRFRKLLEYMSPSDYVIVMQAFERTYQKMREMGVEI